MAALDPFLQGTSSKNTRGLLKIIILLTIAAAAISSRLFSVISKACLISLAQGHTDPSLTGFESIIHECPFPTSLPAL